MNKAEEKIRNKIIDTAKKLGLKKLNHGKAGNISVRWKDGLLITPSGISYDKIKPKDIVFIDKNKSHHGIKKPSIETPFHFDICLLYTSPSPRDATLSRMPSSA